MRFNVKRTLLIAISAAGIAGAGQVLAQTQQPQSPPPQPQQPQQQPQIEVSDAEVEQFAAVYTESREIRQEYSEKFQAAGDQQEAQEIQEQMNQEMMQVIEASPLSAERYQQIAGATAQDQELRERILQEVEQTQ